MSRIAWRHLWTTPKNILMQFRFNQFFPGTYRLLWTFHVTSATPAAMGWTATAVASTNPGLPLRWVNRNNRHPHPVTVSMRWWWPHHNNSNSNNNTIMDTITTTLTSIIIIDSSSRFIENGKRQNFCEKKTMNCNCEQSLLHNLYKKVVEKNMMMQKHCEFDHGCPNCRLSCWL